MNLIIWLIDTITLNTFKDSINYSWTKVLILRIKLSSYKLGHWVSALINHNSKQKYCIILTKIINVKFCERYLCMLLLHTETAGSIWWKFRMDIAYTLRIFALSSVIISWSFFVQWLVISCIPCIHLSY